MFYIKFVTDRVVPSTVVVLATNVDNWMTRGGEYRDGAWQFMLDEKDFPQGLKFKFIIPPSRWMLGNDLDSGPPRDGAELAYTDAQVDFPESQALVTENGIVAQRLLQRSLDNTIKYDVIIVGSGMGGGILAASLADLGLRVLVLEAGSLLFPTHIGNLPRRLFIGQFQKHVWSLWQDFKVRNYNNVAGSEYQGAQAFNLGGRSIFWGGLIPSLAEWELASWPKSVRQYLLEGGGFEKATKMYNADIPDPSPFQIKFKKDLERLVPGWKALDAPVAVEYTGATNWSIPSGMFSTADLLIEDVLAQGAPRVNQPQRFPLAVNLHHAVQRVIIDPQNDNLVTGVECYDILAQKRRTYTANHVVLSAGTIESAKIALLSGLKGSNNLIGKGITDHEIRYRHFIIPPAPFNVNTKTINSAKILLQHPSATVNDHAFDIVIEIGAQFNQGRYVDIDHMNDDQGLQNGALLSEIVFLFYAPLDNRNEVTLNGQEPGTPVNINMRPVTPSPKLVKEAADIATAIFREFNAQAIIGERELYDGNGVAVIEVAQLGGVAHEVGTLRMADNGQGVLDDNLKFLGYKNLFACDNSVFPVSPAGNPSLTLAALAQRLAAHIKSIS